MYFNVTKYKCLDEVLYSIFKLKKLDRVEFGYSIKEGYKELFEKSIKIYLPFPLHICVGQNIFHIFNQNKIQEIERTADMKIQASSKLDIGDLQNM